MSKEELSRGFATCFDWSSGEAVDQNSLLAARRSSEAEVRGGTRSRRQGFFAYFLFPKKVGRNGCLGN